MAWNEVEKETRSRSLQDLIGRGKEFVFYL